MEGRCEPAGEGLGSTTVSFGERGSRGRIVGYGIVRVKTWFMAIAYGTSLNFRAASLTKDAVQVDTVGNLCFLHIT